MGIPVQRQCAAPGCAAVGCSTSGFTFTAAECFTKELPNAPQLWACSLECKRRSLYAILKDLPYRTSKRSGGSGGGSSHRADGHRVDGSSIDRHRVDIYRGDAGPARRQAAAALEAELRR